jgi:uncharacterized membrane protein
MPDLSTTILGVFCAILAALCFNAGPILQKLGLREIPSLENNKNMKENFKSLLFNKKWLSGFILANFGGIPFTFALFFIGLSVVMPILSFGLIILAYFSVKILHEKLTLERKIAILLLILTPIFMTFSDVSTPTRNLTDANVRFIFILVLGIFTIIGVICYIIGKKFVIIYTGASGAFYAVGSSLAQSILSLIGFMGYNLGILDDWRRIWVDFWSFSDILYLFVVLFCIGSIIINVMGIYIQQIGTQKIDISRYAPINSTINAIFSACIGIVALGQIVGNWFLYSLGFICAICGTVILGKINITLDSKV